MPNVYKDVAHGKDARDKIKAGVNQISDAVRATMGAKGRTVITSLGHATKDGVTVARDIDLKDKFAQKGCDLIKQASIQTNDSVGDGTTTVCVEAQYIINHGLDMVDNGKDAQELKREVEEALPGILKALEDQAKPCETKEQLERIASISANDPEIGKLVAEVVFELGAEGHVELQNSGVVDDEFEIVQGMQIDRGIMHYTFSNVAPRKAEYENARVFLADHKIVDAQDLVDFLNRYVNDGSPIIIMAESFDDTVMNSFIATRIKTQGQAKILPMTTPIIDKEDVLQDLSEYTGATIITAQDKYSNLTQDVFGNLAHISTNHERTVMRPVAARDLFIAARIKLIKEEAEKYKDGDRKKQTLARVARLEGRVAVVKVGGYTEKELNERKDRFQDAIFASQAALQGGTVPGAGMSTYVAAQSLNRDNEGERLLYGALVEPMRCIARNAGESPSRVIAHAAEGLGFNAITGEFGDLDEMGIIDPLKVATTALTNAVSVSIVAITTEAVIIRVEEKDE